MFTNNLRRFFVHKKLFVRRNFTVTTISIKQSSFDKENSKYSSSLENNEHVLLSGNLTSPKLCLIRPSINKSHVEDEDDNVKSKKNLELLKVIKKCRKQALNYLMPHNFPKSVHEGYLQYAQWQMLGAICSSVSGTLAIQSMMLALWAPSDNTTVLAPLLAALTWVVKDGLGQLGGIFFASKVSTRFDVEPKKWRFTSAIALDLANILEALTPFFSSHLFLPMAGIQI